MKIYDRDDVNWSDKLTPETKQELFERMPDIRIVNDDGTEMQWKCTNNVWRWKHIAAGGLVLAEGEGAP